MQNGLGSKENPLGLAPLPLGHVCFSRKSGDGPSNRFGGAPLWPSLLPGAGSKLGTWQLTELANTSWWGGALNSGALGRVRQEDRRRSDHEQRCSRENFLLRQVSWKSCVKMPSGGSPATPRCVGCAQTGFPRTRFFTSRGWQVDAGATVNSSIRCGMARPSGPRGWVAGAQGASRGEATGSRSPHPPLRLPAGRWGPKPHLCQSALVRWELSVGTVSSQRLLSPEINKIYILKKRLLKACNFKSLLICRLGLQLVPCTHVLKAPGHLEHSPRSRAENGVCGPTGWRHCPLLGHSLPSSHGQPERRSPLHAGGPVTCSGVEGTLCNFLHHWSEPGAPLGGQHLCEV